MTAVTTDISENLFGIREKIQQCAENAGRDSHSVRLIAVSKTRSLDEVKNAVQAGQKCFGENTVQDAMSKIPFLYKSNLEWHFIGHLQSKKAGKIPGYFQWIHSVDSMKLAEKLSTAMANHAGTSMLNCLIQVNVSGEPSKSGLQPPELKPFLERVLKLELPGLSWRGLMTIGVQGDDRQTRSAFAQLRELQQSCQADFSLEKFDQLSMGMSGDYCMAIEEGATMVRVGTSIFGQRK